MRSRWSSDFGPSLGPMEYAQDLNEVSSHAVGEYVGCAGNHKLTSIWYPARSPGIWVIAKELDSIADTSSNICCGGRVILGDVASQRLEVFDTLIEPPDSHNGDLRSFPVPQLASQASTSSWLIKRAPL